MLQGDPGEGKSTLIIHVAAILTKGGYLPDGQKIKKPEMVIYQCSEDGKGDTIKPRLEQSGADCNSCLLYTSVWFDVEIVDVQCIVSAIPIIIRQWRK